MDTAKLEERLDQLQSEIRGIRGEILKSRRQEEDQLQNQKWRESGLLLEGWCVHRVMLGRRMYYIVCDVSDYYEQKDEIHIRFYTPDILDDSKAAQYIRDILQSIQRLRSGGV